MIEDILHVIPIALACTLPVAAIGWLALTRLRARSITWSVTVVVPHLLLLGW